MRAGVLESASYLGDTGSACRQACHGLSTEEVIEVCIKLLMKANVILSAVACEAVYVESRSAAQIYPYIIKAIKAVEGARKLLSTLNRGGDSSIEKNLSGASESVLLMCHKSINELTAMDFYFLSSSCYDTSAVFLYLNRSIFLVVTAIDIFTSHIKGETALACCDYRNVVTKHDDMINRMEISLRTMVDALDTVNIVVENSIVEKETFLCAIAALLHMSRLFRRDIDNVNIKSMVSSCFTNRLYFIAEGVRLLSMHCDDLETRVVVSRALPSLNNLALEVSSYWRFIPKNPLGESDDTDVARLGMMEGMCAIELMKSLWIKEGLGRRTYSHMSKVRNRIHNVLHICLEEFRESSGRAPEVSTYHKLLSLTDVILKETSMICIPSSVEDSQRFSDLKQRTISAVERVGEMCVKSIKKLEGISERSQVGTVLDMCFASPPPSMGRLLRDGVIFRSHASGTL